MVENRVIVVEDEPVARSGLVSLLRTHRDMRVVGEACSGQAAIKAIIEKAPDLVFLDVQIPECDGFEVVRAIPRDALPFVVFITAFEEYAVQAFEVHAIDYLVKPFSNQRFEQMLDRYRELVNQRETVASAIRLRAMLDHVSTGDGPPKRFPADKLVVNVGRRTVILPVSDIDWIEAQDYCVLVHTKSASHLLRESMGSLVARLQGGRFVRIHRSALINLDRVRELRRPANGEWTIVLQTGAELRVSRRLRYAIAQHFR